ncbi:MAG: SDR family oxidoreductase [Rhodospirillales bacterium]|nr:SDR family oxidoreductase [Rhodospirillales bacterium]
MSNPATSLSKTNVLVTGGSKGIGHACVHAFARLGASVSFTYRSDDASVQDTLKIGEETDGKVYAVQADGTEPDSYKGLLGAVEKNHSGQLDILVNNVGDAISRSSFEDSTDELWLKSFDINLFSAIRATKTFLPLLKKSPNASIINVSSIAGTTTGAGDSLHYGVAKAALDTFTVGLAREMKGCNVRVAGVAPSAIDTDFQTRLSSKERVQKIIDQTPAGRIGTAEEVAEAIVFLASDKASFTSGSVLMMTGGR